MEKVDKDGPIGGHRPDLGKCWIWTAAMNRHGYGVFRVGRPRHAHRVSYEMLIEPIPDGLEIDHICRVRACVNPEHLEPKTHLENMNAPGSLVVGPLSFQGAKTHCPKGHEYTSDNCYIRVGKRDCRACDRERKRKRTTKKARENAF